jgi:hypothetical protein
LLLLLSADVHGSNLDQIAYCLPTARLIVRCFLGFALTAVGQSPTVAKTLGRYFARLNAHHLRLVTVLEMREAGGELVCLHGSFPIDLKQS